MAWYHRLINVVRPSRLSRDLDREMDFHVAERADELVARGMRPADAEREARRRFGNRTTQRERSHDVSVVVWLESLFGDLRYALRALRRSPAFTLVAVLSLGLGIGANTAIFSLVDAVILKSLPVRDPGALMRVTMGEDGGGVFTNPIWEELRNRQDVFAGAFAVSNQSFDLTSGGEVRRVAGSWVGGDFFGTLGVRPSAGRVLSAGDDVRGCPATAVLSHGYWQSAYGGDPSAVGRVIPLDGHSFTIVGVAQQGFSGIDVGRPVQVYAPLCSRAVIDGSQRVLDERSTWFLEVIGRRKPGVSVEQVLSKLTALSPSIFAATLPPWEPAHQQEYLKYKLTAEPAATGLSGLRTQYGRALLTLMVVVGTVLLVACANVANLLLARAAVRQREIAVRIAIGAGRGRIVRQLLTESLLLAILGAAAGIAFANWGSRLLVGLLEDRSGAVLLNLGVDVRVLGFTLLVATVTGLLFGLAPAWRATRIDPQSAMKARGRGVVAGSSRFGVAQALVAGQVALSLALLVSAGLLLGTFRKLTTLDPGFDRRGVLLVGADLQKAGIEKERLGVVHRELLDRLREVPGVRAASASNITPVSGSGWNGPITVEGYTAPSERDAIVYYNAVSDGFFATLGTSLIAGRDFSERDAIGSPPVAIINEALARKFFGSASPVGKRFRAQMGPDRKPELEIVGIARDTKYRNLREDSRPIVYIPTRQEPDPWPAAKFELRAQSDPTALIPAVTAAVARINPAISLEYTTLASQVDRSLSRERLLATLSGFFGALALLLAVVGLYGTMAYSVARRRNEIGIRIALGAARGRVVRMVLGEAGVVVVAGLVLGAMLALATTRLVASFLFETAPNDPVTMALSALTLAVAALAAGAIPAWRAARLDPTEALREE